MSTRRRTASPLALLLVLLLCCGCFNTLYVASENAYVTTKTGDGTPFKVRAINGFGLWGLVPALKVVEVDRVVSRKLGRDIRHITGLKISEGVGPEQFATVITLGLYSPRALIIEGEFKEEGSGPAP